MGNIRIIYVVPCMVKVTKQIKFRNNPGDSGEIFQCGADMLSGTFIRNHNGGALLNMIVQINGKVAFIILISLWISFFHTGQSYAQLLTREEIQGRQVYLKGTSPSGNDILAYIGKSVMEMPGSAATCVSCHGVDGRGLREHGIEATSIVWEDLTRSYTDRRIKKRLHPPYDGTTLVRAVVEGIDPAGNRLDDTMPRYRMSEKDFDHLIAYLKVIAARPDPGMSAEAVRLGTVLPSDGTFSEMGQVMRQIMNAYFMEINKKGGIYNRHIQLVSTTDAGNPESTITAIRKLTEEDQVFALVSPFTMGADTEAAGFAESHEVPMVGPFTLYPEDIYSLNRYTFYLLSGLREQARVQVVFAVKVLKNPDPRVALIYPDTESSQEIADASQTQMSQYNWKSVEKMFYLKEDYNPAQMAGLLAQRKTEAIFFLGPWHHLQSLIREADLLKWYPFVFISGAQTGHQLFDIPSGFSQKVFITYPALPGDSSPEGIQQLQHLHEKYGISGKHMAAQISALTAAKVMVEAMTRAGKHLSREKLVLSLDTLFRFDTRLLPPLTYEPNRRIGALGAHVVKLDLEKKTLFPAAPWISLE